MTSNKKVIEELLAKYKIPCSCPKGGIIDEEKDLVCPKCDGSEWVFPDDIKQALSAQKQDTKEMIEGRILIYDRHSNVWYRKGNGALYTNSDEIAKQENQVLKDIIKNL